MPESGDTVRDGVRIGIPFGIAAGLVGLSFGVVAEPVMGAVAAIAMSAVVFAGASQFAATTVLAEGGSVSAAVAAGVLMNARFLPMGIALAPWLPGDRLARAAAGQAVVDASWAAASRGGGRFAPYVMLGATIPQYPAWVGGTVVGALGGGLIGDPETLGLDALFPAFFLALIVEELGRPGAKLAALGGAAIAIALVPFTPPGIPILAAAAAALMALRVRPA